MMSFYGKPVDETMTKIELLEVIEYLADEMEKYKQEVHNNIDIISQRKMGLV